MTLSSLDSLNSPSGDRLFDPGPALTHPARYNLPILDAIHRLLPGAGVVLDMFAGTGRIHMLATPRRRTIGVELEPEWANLHRDTIVGNALDLPFRDATFDAVATSPCYGNRFADGWAASHKYLHRTYSGDLGRKLHPDNAGQLQWGAKYQAFHLQAWTEALRVLKPGGVLVLNIKDHVRNGDLEPVTQWHIDTLEGLGLRSAEPVPVETPSLTRGANYDLRAPCEWVIKFTAPTHPTFTTRRNP
jgi:SAM-dependent methyltransferase